MNFQTIIANVYHDVAGGDHSAYATLFFSGPLVIFTTNLGSLSSKSALVPWVNGLAITILKADKGAGIATVTASDYEVVQTLVNIQEAPKSANETSLTSNVRMEDTGFPVTGMIVSILLVLGGLISAKKWEIKT